MIEVQRLSLSLREQDVGGGVRTEPVLSDPSLFISASHLVLLIHGYNNDRQAAAEAYEGFHARQREIDPEQRYALGRVFVDVYWPGDADWGAASFLFYMGSVQQAVKSAERLAAFLSAQLTAGVLIDIIAHSMGCRLSLELLRALDNMDTGMRINRITFLAGAVPTFMLEQQTPTAPLRKAYAATLQGSARSLYSSADKVLSMAFPLGQSLAPGEEGALPTALGHAYWGEENSLTNLYQSENPDADHSDYWGWNAKAKPLRCAQHAAQLIREHLQFPAAGARRLPARVMLKAETLEGRETIGGRGIQGR